MADAAGAEDERAGPLSAHRCLSRKLMSSRSLGGLRVQITNMFFPSKCRTN